MRCKQRVGEKTPALSVEDLEHIAALKRCGLRVDVEDDVLALSARANSTCASAAAQALR